DKTAATVAFEKMLQSILNKGLTIERPKPGGEITAGHIALQVFAPNAGDYADVNNYSIVCKLIYGRTSFLFMGDAEALSEKEMLAQGYDLSANVLKIGHHGSVTSTDPAFLAAVHPDMAVISCAEDNSYGHPHTETLEKLENAQATVYRTDLQGTITMRSDGNSIAVETEKPGA
ncbi:MAG: MBL fold metallo-hydrolase, partial [Clostridiales bacterium]|nr:MBL fold metallo-hydrolase [Clostridiales bacterium]